MGDWAEILLSRYRDKDHLALPKYGLVFALSVAAALSLFGIFVFDPNTVIAKASWVLAPSLIMLVIWYAYRHIYYRYGKGIRVGLAFVGRKINSEDLAETRLQMSACIRDMQLNKDIHFKLCPYDLRTGESASQFLRKQNLDHLFVIEVSLKTDQSGDKHYTLNHNLVSPKPKGSRWVEIIEEHAGAFLNRPAKQASSLLELEKYKSNRIADTILLAIALAEIDHKKFDRASKFAHALDVRLSSDLAPDEYPRNFLRYIDVVALMLPSSIPMKDLPKDPAVLSHAAERAELAIRRYGDEHSLTIVQQSRTLTLLGRIDEAYELILNCPSDAQSQGGSTIRLVLARLVLNLFKSNWSYAGDYAIALLAHSDLGILDWDDLVMFSEYMHDCGFSQEGMYLSGLYKRIRDGKPSDRGQDSRVIEWLKQDASRAKLRKAYHSAQFARHVSNDLRRSRPSKLKSRTKRISKK